MTHYHLEIHVKNKQGELVSVLHIGEEAKLPVLEAINQACPFHDPSREACTGFAQSLSPSELASL